MDERSGKRRLAADPADQTIFVRSISARDGNFRSFAFFAYRAYAEMLQEDGLASLMQHASSGSDLRIAVADDIVHQEVRRGSITVHDEWVVHGSGGNASQQWRKTYVIAYRSQATVALERSIGFTHSHNDQVNWTTALDLARS